jgi:acylphosphatase
MERSRVNCVAYGKMRDVFFRSQAFQEAQRLGVAGYVMAFGDNGIEVVAEGPQHALEELVAWMEHGPQGAQVEDFRVRWEKPQGDFNTFRIREL